MKDIKLFIWDFDGTLLDTYPNMIRYLQLALEDFGHFADSVDVHEKMMTNVQYAVDYYSRLYDLPDLMEHYLKHRADLAPNVAEAFPYVEQVLQRICQMGAANYIFTNRGKSTFPMLERIGILQYFTEIVTSADPHFKVKPAPDSIVYLMEKYGGTPENTVMIGDRYCDLESGYRAGCKTLHLLTPSVPQYPPCDWRVANFKEMLELLR